MEFRAECQRCRSSLSPESSAYICANDCTFCATCVRPLGFVCPNCGGELVRRPRQGAAPIYGKIPGALPASGVTVRRATVHDLDSVAPLFDAYRQFYLQPANLANSRRFLEERLETGTSVILVAEGAGTPQGFTQLYSYFTSVSLGPIFVLNDLFVAPSARRSGVGAQLLAAAREFAGQQGARYLELSTAVDNPAQHLYETMGWIPDREYLHYELSIPTAPETRDASSPS